MNNGMMKKIVLLAALFVAGGCASTNNEILSAEDAASMITVTVTPAPADRLVAAVNPEAE